MENVVQSVRNFRVTTSEIYIYQAIVLLVVIWGHFKWIRRNFEKVAAKMKGPNGYPFIGSSFAFIGSSEQVMEKVLELDDKYSPGPFKLWLGPYFGVIVIKPEDVQAVFNNSKALGKDRFYNFMKSIFGEGLLTAPVHKWRKHRRLITPLFNTSLLHQFFPVFIDKNKILIKNLKKELGKTTPFDLWDYIAPITLNLICQNAMGYNLDTESQCGSEFEKAMIKSSELVSIRMKNPFLHLNFMFKLYLKFKGHSDIFNTLFKLPLKIIQEKRNARRNILNKPSAVDVTDDAKNKSKVFLDTLIELNEAGANLSDNDIKDEVVTMMFGGMETSAITLCFCLLLLAIYPDIQDKVYDEIYEVFKDSDETITIEDSTKLVYLEQVLKETLRLFPVSPLLLRELQDDVKIVSDNHILPKGTTCVISVIGTHHFSELYPNPWTFNPDNFSPENTANRHKYSFLAFSGGPRGCLGSKYAMMSMKVAMSTFLRNYSVHTHYTIDDIKLKLDLLMRSANGYPVTIQLRDRRPTYIRNKNL